MGLSLSPLCQSDEDDPPTLVRSPTGCLEAEIPKSLPSDFTATSGFIQTEKGSEGNGCVYCRQPRKGMCRKWTMGQPLTQQVSSTFCKIYSLKKSLRSESP